MAKEPKPVDPDKMSRRAQFVETYRMAKRSDPPFDGTVLIEMRRPHTSGGWTGQKMRDEMAARAFEAK